MTDRRLFISADMEGVAGVTSPAQLRPDQFEYSLARAWMTNEVAAVCNVALERGYEEIVVADSHGNAQNLLLDRLPEKVCVIRGWPRPHCMMEGIQHGKFNAAMLIGYHGGATDLKGSLNHTLSSASILEVRLNDMPVSETLISAATAGHFGVPVVMVSGDDGYTEHAKCVLGNVSTVTTKWTTGLRSTQTLLPRKACELIREKTSSVLGDLDRYELLTIEGPIRLEVTLKNRMAAEVLCYLKTIERVDAKTVRYISEDMVDVNMFLTFLLHSVDSIK